MYYYSQTMNQQEWAAATHPEIGAAAQHNVLFGDAWARAAQIEPFFPPGLIQPPMILPFSINKTWSYTAGPHGAWTIEGAQAALDFAPSSAHGCAPSDLWVVATAPGVIARVGEGFLILDLNGDGLEQTGWNVFYLHLESLSNMVPGKWVDKGDKLGHPSCKGGRSTGTHLHIARKYNGEWMAADGPIPFTLSGWQAIAGDEPYEGSLIKGEEITEADPVGGFASNIKRSSDDP
jgi:murein DD-endopeptidase MepM/ murein hydrolase activator NlpD